MNFIILDLEATCWEGDRNFKNEIIEIGAVLVNDKKEIVSEFSKFVKPLKNPILSTFCKELTSIQQSDVDSAQHFNIVLKEFQNWFGIHEEEYCLCSWGFYDKKQFESDCSLFGLDKSWLKHHISLKHQHADIKQLSRAIGMKGALAMENLELKGTHHRGIDDARNITKIFLMYFDKWNFRI